LTTTADVAEWALRGGARWLHMVRELSGGLRFTDDQLQRVREFRQQLDAVIDQQETKRQLEARRDRYRGDA
jgi:hypothetical protein